MWAYQFINSKTRNMVPGFGNFMKQNHDLAKVIYEENWLPLKERTFIIFRFFKFVTYLCVLFILTNVMINSQDEYYKLECDNRKDCLTACVESHFPKVTCNKYPSTEFAYKKNKFTHIYKFSYPTTNIEKNIKEFNKCKDFIEDNPDYPEVGTGRQAKIHICFNGCQYSSDSEDFPNDFREICKIGEDPSLLCVHPDEDCEHHEADGEVYFYGDVTNKYSISFAPLIGLLAMICTLPLQFIFEIFCIWVNKKALRADPPFWYTITFFILQFLIACMTFYLISLSILLTLEVQTYGRPGQIFLTFGFAFLVDQVKSILFLFLIWFCLIRRCGFLAPNESEYLSIFEQEESPPNFIQKLREFLLLVIESKAFETTCLWILGIYCVLILAWLIISDFQFIELDSILSRVDLLFLTWFLIEISLKLFAIGIRYLYDFWNLFDAIVVIAAFVTNVTGGKARGLAILRLFRFIVVTLQNASGNPEKFRHKSKKYSRLELVNKSLKNIQSHKCLTTQMKTSIDWVLQIIQDNKVYIMKVERINQQPGGAKNNSYKADMDYEAYTELWLRLATHKANDPSAWFTKDIKDLIKEMQSSNNENNEGIEETESDEIERSIQQYLNIPNKTWLLLNRLTDQFNKPHFDTFQLCAILNDKAICYMGFKLFHNYNLFKNFNIEQSKFYNFLVGIHEAYNTGNHFHTIEWAIDSLRFMHFLIFSGNLLDHITQLNVISGLLAPLLQNAGHPGVNNQYLTKSHHPMSIRYNDNAILEQYCLCQGFKTILNPHSDIFSNMTEEQYWTIRNNIIKMCLYCDICNHFTNLIEIKTKLAQGKFPEDTSDDKQLILNLALYTTQFSTLIRPKQVYVKWMLARVNEWLTQGDMERRSGVGVTPIFERTRSNPFLLEKGYIHVLAQPTLTIWVQFIPHLQEDFITNGLEENAKFIREKVEESQANLGVGTAGGDRSDRSVSGRDRSVTYSNFGDDEESSRFFGDDM